MANRTASLLFIILGVHQAATAADRQSLQALDAFQQNHIQTMQLSQKNEQQSLLNSIC